MSHGIIHEETELYGDEQSLLRDVFEGGGAAALACNFGTLRFRLNKTLLGDSVAARGPAQRSGVGKVKTLAIWTLWLQEVVRDGTTDEIEH